MILRKSEWIIAVLLLPSLPLHAGLKEYVEAKDQVFAWKLKEKKETSAGTIYEIHLVSQEWQKMKWEHALLIYQPTDTKPSETLFLWNTGGKPSFANNFLGMQIATKLKAPIAFLYDIPNQPLFEGKKEDALIAETFVRFLETKDESWPLLFPMVKSVVRSMDALQAFGKAEWKLDLKHFVISGASKRGWTSWLSAATADPRIKAIAPLVIDTLNLQSQMPHQLKSYGDYSKMIRDYTDRKLVPLPDTVDAKKLWGMVDPWVYREKLTLPKMIINGTNDPYWTQDATNLYWNDLKGDKWLLYVPNAGHGLDQKYEDGRKDRNRAVFTLAAFARHQMDKKPLPTLEWKHEGNGKDCSISVKCNPAPKTARIWVADAETRDFRNSTWIEQPAKLNNGVVQGSVQQPETGWRTFFAECEFEIDGTPYYLSTQLRMIGK